MHQPPSTATVGVRTWRRLSDDQSLPLDARISETTDPNDMDHALGTADFVTIPRAAGAPHGGGAADGYDDVYASAFAVALVARYGYSGAIRTSTSGRSFVFEREAAFGGGAVVDLGVRPQQTHPQQAHPQPTAQQQAGPPFADPVLRRVAPTPALRRPPLPVSNGTA